MRLPPSPCSCSHLSSVYLCLPACLQELKDKHSDVMREMLMDVLRALSAPNLDIRKKTLDIALDLIDARNIDEVGWAGWAGRTGHLGEGTLC